MSAVISECGRYRYRLWREPEGEPEGPAAVFLMLNPSTADADQDDPTIRRCRAFARQWGCNGLVVVNLYAFRSVSPKAMVTAPDPVGPLNDVYLERECSRQDVICAWGRHGGAERVASVLELLKRVEARTFCLGVNMDGSPKHPLYLKSDSVLQPYDPKGYL